jgi:acyl-CoA dehydrogenase
LYGLTDEDRRIRDTARAFVETLMPCEVDAELAGGLLPKELTAEHQARAIELGLYAANMPASVGGPGCTALQQVLVQEQCGRVTNGLGWGMATPPQWWVEVASEYQLQRWLRPAVRGEKHEAYAITEEFAGSDVSALEATARRVGDEYVINGVKWHVTRSPRAGTSAAPRA